MKTINRCLIAICISMAFPNFAHATFFDSYAELYTVGSSGSTTAVTQFTGVQVPYLYIEFYNNDTFNLTLPPNAYTKSFWHDPTTFNIYRASAGSDTDQLWLSLSPTQWSSINVPGTWTINVRSAAFDNNQLEGFFGGSTTFTVLGNGHHGHNAPEAKSTILFLIGGGIMILFILRRKKSAYIPLY